MANLNNSGQTAQALLDAQAAKWTALERAVALAGLPASVCGEFMWMCEQAGAHQYKNRATRNYCHLRGTESRGDCEMALAHARSMGEKWADRPKMSWEWV
jgi:hypothetical protein